MRLKVSESKNAKSLYVIKSVYNPKTKSNTSKVVEKLGTYKELCEKLNGQDPIEWAKQYIEELNQKEKESKRDVVVKYSQSARIQKDSPTSLEGGYLFLQKLYHDLKLDDICETISKRRGFQYDLNSILSRLVYARILSPSSKRSTFETVQHYLEPPDFKLHDVYRSLEVLCEEMDFIQAQLYKNTLCVFPRKTGILYYDCTNFFFETEQPCGLKQYGQSKEHRPNPIVQMGLFMDQDGIPLAFHIQPGNTNEQVTLQPLEKQLISDFGLSKFVVCTDAGLASQANRVFNDKQERAFVTTQSLKKLKKHLRQWALEPTGWHLEGKKEVFDLKQIDEDLYSNRVFFKERWIKENGLEQKLIVTYSIRYKRYQQAIRERQITRAQKLIRQSPSKLNKTNANDCRRFIQKTNVTSDGEVAEKTLYRIDVDAIQTEMQYDGFYAVCTNLDEGAATISKINHRRWEIEECFRIMKSEFKARPVYLSRDERIKAHFITCFIALLLYRLLEASIGGDHTCEEIIETLQGMRFQKIENEGYVPTYTRTDLTDTLHETFGFHTDYEIVTEKNMKKIFKLTKTKKKVREKI